MSEVSFIILGVLTIKNFTIYLASKKVNANECRMPPDFSIKIRLGRHETFQFSPYSLITANFILL